MMNRFSTLCLLLAMTSFRLLALPPEAKTALRNHLTEVNREWIAQQSHLTTLSASQLTQSAEFATDPQRITAHLLAVTTELRARTDGRWSASQRQHRLALLDKLEGYARRGEFPVNLYHRHRQPYFIDHRGVHCAVGYLMQQSGSDELALRIHREMNYAYVREIALPEVGQWADTHGFDVDELAWIQPAYPSQQTVFGMDGGTNGEVKTFAQDPATGDLLVGGAFSVAGGDTAWYFSRWNGSQLTPFTQSQPLMGAVYTSAVINGQLWVGGAFCDFCGTPPYPNLARWNGTGWTYFTAGWGPVYDMQVIGSELYVAGDLNNGDFVYSSNVFAVTANDSIYAVGDGFNGPIYALDFYNGGLVAGGAFTGTLSGDSISYLATYPLLTMPPIIKWAPLFGGFDNEVRAIAKVDDQLIVGGKLADAQGNPTMGMGYRMAGLPNWVPVYGFEQYPAYLPEHSIHCMEVTGGTVVVGGNFSLNSMVGIYGSQLGKVEFWMSQVPHAEALNDFDGPVKALALQNNKLYIGGNFVVGNYSTDSLNNLAQMDFATALDDIAGTMQVTVAPNPVAAQCEVNLSQPLSLRLYDVTGKIWLALEGKEGANALNMSSLPSGTYYLAGVNAQGKFLCSRAVVKE